MLCARLGFPTRHALKVCLTAKDYQEWMAFCQLAPWMFAPQIGVGMPGFGGGGGARPAQSEEEMRAAVGSIIAARNARRERKQKRKERKA